MFKILMLSTVGLWSDLYLMLCLLDTAQFFRFFDIKK